LYYNLLLCFIPLEMHVRLICAIKFYLLTYLHLLPLLNYLDIKLPAGIKTDRKKLSGGPLHSSLIYGCSINTKCSLFTKENPVVHVMTIFKPSDTDITQVL